MSNCQAFNSFNCFECPVASRLRPEPFSRCISNSERLAQKSEKSVRPKVLIRGMTSYDYPTLNTESKWESNAWRDLGTCQVSLVSANTVQLAPPESSPQKSRSNGSNRDCVGEHMRIVTGHGPTSKTSNARTPKFPLFRAELCGFDQIVLKWSSADSM